MQANFPDGLLVSVSDFTFGESVSDPTLLTFAVSDGSKAKALLNADYANTIPLGSALIHGIAPGSFTVTATDNSSSGPQTSSALAMTATAKTDYAGLPVWKVALS